MESITPKKKIIELGKFLFEQGYVVATDGNISLRLNEQEILITRSGVCKGELNLADIVKININDWKSENITNQLEAHYGYKKDKLKSDNASKKNLSSWEPKSKVYQVRPSSEYRMHLAIYAQRPEINAVVHAHPPFATTFAVVGKKLDVNLLTETEQFLGSIKYLGYYQPGSIELAKTISRAVIKHNVIILAKHGAVVCGLDLNEARYRLERLEFLARITWLSLIIPPA